MYHLGEYGRQGEDGDNFYIINSGVFDIFVKENENGQQRLVATHTNSGTAYTTLKENE